VNDDRRDPTQPDRRKDGNRRGGRRADDPQAAWLTIAAYARLYGIGRDTVYKWLSADLLWTYRVGPILRIRNLPPDQHRLPQQSVDDCR